MKEDIEKRRAEAAERKKQIEEEVSAKPAFAINPKGSSKVRFGALNPIHESLPSLKIPIMQLFIQWKASVCIFG